jgi:DNA-directed RNA polymerase sigma subunit (sigma70/sigma32)
MDITPDKVLEIQQYAREPWSLEELLDDSDFSSTFEALWVDDAAAAELKRRQQAAIDAIHALDSRPARILMMRFGFASDEPMTLEEIGEIFGVTRERIRQIEAKALKWLADHVDRDLTLWGMWATAPSVSRQPLAAPSELVDEKPARRDNPTASGSSPTGAMALVEQS